VRLSLATGVPIIPVATWGGQYVWRRDGRQSVAFGRPIWLRAGEPFDAAARTGADPDHALVRAVTDQLMGELASLVDGLRRRYPERWTNAERRTK
jgi:1-acyl-sn-glycerol-3-phosphate acyltransferase